MAKTNKIVEEGVQTDYTSVIVSYSNGIDSTGALYWALKEFPKEKIFLLYCDTGFEYPENIQMFYRTAKLNFNEVIKNDGWKENDCQSEKKL